jgi:hypothetical protein
VRRHLAGRPRSDGRADLADAEYERSKSLAGDHQINDCHALMPAVAQEEAAPRLIEARFRQYNSQDFNALLLTRYLLQHGA